jgi:hypothetical protein
MSKRALLVGINNFQDPDINALNGCINDTLTMRDLLKAHFGFEEQEIGILHDAQANSQGIRDGLAWLLSGYEGGGSDVRVFHFSSHGTQVDDQSGDELDCQDEVILPYDHDWEDPFRDDDLREIFDPVPEDVQFTFIADCCHSGTIQKALIDNRIEFIPRYVTPPDEILDRIEALQRVREERVSARVTEELDNLPRDLSPQERKARRQILIQKILRRLGLNRYDVIDTERHILLAACEDRQTAADAPIGDDWRGAFTWALGQAIQEAGGDLTYGALIRRAGVLLKRYAQTPQLECPRQVQDMKLFASLGAG